MKTENIKYVPSFPRPQLPITKDLSHGIFATQRSPINAIFTDEQHVGQIGIFIHAAVVAGDSAPQKTHCDEKCHCRSNGDLHQDRS